MNFYYFYILRSKKNEKLYLGFTKNWKKRFKQHNSGSESATKPNVPYEIIYLAGFISKKDAIECEKYFKTTSGWKRLKRMLKNTLKWTPSIILQLKKVTFSGYSKFF